MNMAEKPFELSPIQYRQIKFMSPNINELRKIAQTLKLSTTDAMTTTAHEDDFEIDNGKYFNEISELCDKLHDVVENIIVTAGCHGVFIQRFFDSEKTFFTRDLKYIGCNSEDNNKKISTNEYSLRHYPSMMVEKNVRSTSGAGDSFAAGFIAGMLNHKSEAICVSIGFEAALAALRSINAVPQEYFNKNHKCWNTPASFNVIKR
jgi:sugar/nucleoside kinase (ribokinase family)